MQSPSASFRILAAGLQLSAAAWLAVSAPAQAQKQRVITGVVIDSGLRPIPWVNVQVSGHSRLITDDSGHFRVTAKPQDKLTLGFRRIGYLPRDGVIVAPGDSSVTVVLAVIAQKLSGTTIVASVAKERGLEDNGFYDRLMEAQRGINHGYFVTPEDIDKRKPLRVTHMLEGIPGLVFTHRVGQGEELDPRAIDVRGPTIDHFGNGLSGNDAHCFMSVYLDGHRIIGGTTSAQGVQTEPVDLQIDVGDVSGIEVYPYPSGVPPKYQMLNGTCGVVLIWTK